MSGVLCETKGGANMSAIGSKGGIRASDYMLVYNGRFMFCRVEEGKDAQILVDTESSVYGSEGYRLNSYWVRHFSRLRRTR